MFWFCWPCVHLGVIFDTGGNIMGCKWSFLGHFGGQSWDLISFLVMVSYGQDMDDFFLILIILLQWLFSRSHIKIFLLLIIFYVVLFMHINTVSVLIGIFCRIDVVIWVFKVGWVHFRCIVCNCSFGRGQAWGLNIIVGLFGSWPMFMFFKVLFSYCLLLDETPPPERACFQFSIILHQ